MKFLALSPARVALCATMHTPDSEDFTPGHTPGHTPDQSVVYKVVGGTQLKLHIFRNPDHQPSDRRPAIVFFHGGGWARGTPAQLFPQCRYLAGRGMVAISAEYRLSSVHGTSPREALMDGISAIRWVRGHASRLGIDPERIAAGGGSAGGQVAAASATSHGFDEAGEDLAIGARPNALILFNPVFDNGPNGYGHGVVEAYWQAFSPMHNIDANTPPTVVFLGTEDHLIPVQTAKDYQHRMHEYGRRCDLHLFDGCPHGFFNYRPAGPHEIYLRIVGEVDRFLVSLGYLQPLA